MRMMADVFECPSNAKTKAPAELTPRFKTNMTCALLTQCLRAKKVLKGDIVVWPCTQKDLNMSMPAGLHF
jgi:hypothetical protein